MALHADVCKFSFRHPLVTIALLFTSRKVIYNAQVFAVSTLFQSFLLVLLNSIQWRIHRSLFEFKTF